MRRLIERFGEPEEVVESYRATEAQVAAALAQPRRDRRPTRWTDLRRLRRRRSYGALIFMLLSLPVGIIYFVWAVTGCRCRSASAS